MLSMEVRCFLGLLVFWLIGGVSADVSEDVPLTRSTVCGFEFQYWEFSNGFCFLINQKAVDHFSFCWTVEHYAVSGCLPYRRSDVIKWRRIRKQICSREISHTADIDNSSIKAGRRLMHRPLTNPPCSSKLDGHGHLSLSSTKLAPALPVVFLLCCALICPCFRAKRKEISDQVVEPKGLFTFDSTPSIDVSTKSDRVPGSPLRVPASSFRVLQSPLRAPKSPLRAPNSPLRAPYSPLRLPPSPSRFSMSPQLSRARSVHLNISQIIRATNNFSPSYMIGEGSFGNVYKAQLPNGQLVAAKRARQRDFSALETEFTSEVDMLARIEHRSLVRLLDCIDNGNERIIITEYVSNGTLREHLDGQHGRILDFSQRLEISIDVCHALTYLHTYAEWPIIHRDVKSSKILLTDSFRAKVTGFGLAKTGSTDANQTHVSTKVKGTIGYIDPVYLNTSQLTPKSDVYSFGVLLVEILSGRRPIEAKRAADEKVSLRWAFGKDTEGNLSEVLDPLLEETVDKEIVEKMLSLALQCAAPILDDRPVMKEAAVRLWDIRKSYRTLRRV